MSQPSPPPASPALPSILLALLGGMVVLLVLPVGFIPFVLRAESVANAWLEGGSGMWLVLGAAVVAALIGGLLVAVVARVTALAAVVLPVLVALPALVGVLMTRSGVHGSVLAVEHASPADRATILMGSVTEALWTATFGGFMSFGLALGLAAGLAVAAVARTRDVVPTHRHATLFGALVFVGLAALSLVGALATRQEGDAYALVAMGPPDVEALRRALETSRAWLMAYAFTALTAAVLALVGAKWLRTPRGGTFTFGVASLAGVGLLAATVRPAVPAEVIEAIVSGSSGPARFMFQAPSIAADLGLFVGDEPVEELRPTLTSRLAQLVDLRDAAGMGRGAESMNLHLLAPVTKDALAVALEVLATGGVREVNLLTGWTTEAASALPAPFAQMSQPVRGVTVEVGFRGERCAEPCTPATLTGETLVVGDERWPLETGADDAELPHGDVVWLPLQPREPTLLLRAGLTAMKHGRRLGLLLEGDPPKPKPAPRELAEDEPPRPLASVEVATVSVQGPLDAKRTRAELAEQAASLASCLAESLEPVTLPLTVKLQLAVGSLGTVPATELVDRGPVDDEDLEYCLLRLPQQWSFTAPPKTAMSLVTATVTFKPVTP